MTFLKILRASRFMAWLSIGLQDSLTVDLWYVSALNTKSLVEFSKTIRDRCQAMELDCVTEMEAADWQIIAREDVLDWFLWGNYQIEGEAVLVKIGLYRGPSWALQGEMTFKTPLSRLLRESSERLLHFLNTNGVPLKSEEKKRVLSQKTHSVEAWNMRKL